MKKPAGNVHPPAPAISDHTPPTAAGHDIFFAAVQTTRMPMVVTDPHQPDNPIIFVNDAFIFMTGYEESEIVGRNCRFLQGPETDREIVAQVAAAIETRQEISVEILNYRKNGSTFWNALFISPVYAENGDLLYFFASQLDISRRREAEEALHEAQKMEAVGQLTGGIAHDFNNLLQVILGYVDILEARVDSGDRPTVRAVEAIGSAASRAATLTQQLLAFARKQELRDRLLNLNSLVTDFRPIIDRGAGDGVTVRYRLDDSLWNSRVDPVQAEMALLNVVKNAGDAMAGTGQITISTRNFKSPEDGDDATRKLKPGEYVAITVADTGPGIDSAIADKIFDPFFTTKAMGKGTGLGLAMVSGFTRQSGGLAVAANGDDGGAEITLFFPRASGAIDRRPASGSQKPDGGAERVLMVEDQADVAELGCAILVDLGYDVTLVANAREALDVIDRDSDFKLLFTDILMPGSMNGVGLANAIKRRFPRIAILLTTGFADDVIDEGAKSYELIRKPYRRSELNQRLRQVLDKPGART